MKKVTAVLVVYAIIVIASSIFWAWCALSKSSLTAESNKSNVKLATDADRAKQDAAMVTDKAIESTDGVRKGATAPDDTA